MRGGWWGLGCEVTQSEFPLSSGEAMSGSRIREPVLPPWLFGFDSGIWFPAHLLPDSIIKNICRFMRSRAALTRLL